jgi:hypothetical protein
MPDQIRIINLDEPVVEPVRLRFVYPEPKPVQVSHPRFVYPEPVEPSRRVFKSVT